MKPIPKSLHTVTVIVKLARYHHNAERGTYDRSIVWAVKFLGYADTPDTHGLAAAALKQLAPKARGTVTGKIGPFGTRTGRFLLCSRRAFIGSMLSIIRKSKPGFWQICAESQIAIDEPNVTSQ